jgi:hypothetical protein
VKRLGTTTAPATARRVFASPKTVELDLPEAMLVG